MRRIFGIAALSGVLLFTIAGTQAAPQKNKAQKGKAAAVSVGNADAVTQDELKEYIYFLASDLLEGRNAPSRGYDIATLYIASHLKEWGLKPGGSQTGTDGPLQPYLMPIELVNNSLDAAGMKLSLVVPAAARGGRGGAGVPAGGRAGAAPAAPREYAYAKDWTVGAGGGFGGGGGRGGGGGMTPADITNAQLVFVGNGYVINKTNTNPYQDIDVSGKVMIVAGQPAEMVQAMQAQQAAAAAARAGGAGAAAGARGGGRGGAAANPLGVEGTDFTSPQIYAAKNGALGVIMVPNFQQLSSMAAPPAGGGRGAGLNGPSFQVVKFQAAQTPAVPTITAGLDLINALFQGEKLSAAQVFEGAAANVRLESFALNTEKKLSLRVAVNTLKGHTANVVGIIEGSDPVLKNEYIIFSAHLDHVGLSSAGALGDPINNGADDDGSGCAALMAMARTFAEGAAKGMKPKRSLLFLWVTGEEKGLWGSRYFCQFPPIDITKVVADLNMDMISRSKSPEYKDPPNYKLAEAGEVFIVGPHISSGELLTMVESINAGYFKVKLNDFYDVTAPDATHDNLGNGQRIFTRSDHYNFARMGIPVAFFTTGLHIDYHQVTDSADRIDYKQFETITRTVAALGWNLANTATPPKLNEKLPEALVNAMKQAKEDGWGKLTPVLPPVAGGKF